MVNWKTYLVLHFGTSSGKKPTQIAMDLETLGFKTVFGSVDFIYDWPSEPSKQEVLGLGDKISDLLNGSGSVFNLDTHE